MRYFYEAWAQHPVLIPVSTVVIGVALAIWSIFSLLNAFWTPMTTWKLLHIIFSFATLCIAPLYVGLTVYDQVFRGVSQWMLVSAYVVFNVLELMVFVTQAPLLRDSVLFSTYGLNLKIWFGVWGVYTFVTFMVSLFFSFPHGHQKVQWQRRQMDWHVRNLAMLLFGLLMFSVLRASKTVGNVLFVFSFLALIGLSELVIFIANRYAPAPTPRGRDKTPKRAPPAPKKAVQKVAVKKPKVVVASSYSYEYYTGTPSSATPPRRKRGFF